MRQITIIETPEELLNAANNVRPAGDKSISLPSTVKLRIDDDDELMLVGQGSEAFAIGQGLKCQYREVVALALKRCGLEVTRENGHPLTIARVDYQTGKGSNNGS